MMHRFDLSDVRVAGLAGEGPESDGVPWPPLGPQDTERVRHDQDDTVPTAFSAERAAQAN